MRLRASDRSSKPLATAGTRWRGLRSSVTSSFRPSCARTRRCTFAALRHRVSFEDVYLVKPMARDLTERPRVLFPHEARTRSSTYALTVLVNIRHEQRPLTEQELQRRAERQSKKKKKKKPNPEGAAAAAANTSAGARSVLYRAVTLCELPCMVRSKYCNLTGDTCAAPWALRGRTPTTRAATSS